MGKKERKILKIYIRNIRWKIIYRDPFPLFFLTLFAACVSAPSCRVVDGGGMGVDRDDGTEAAAGGGRWLPVLGFFLFIVFHYWFGLG
ncbi:hypothetical protein ES288_A01G237600v1 [Gossypium darwinii]|uniref:Transmembrane protein n=1 Tax=Gossypium darwinii TaxID=34276 RepID=A0A5D2HRC9_GOSDA|nr:hypothetical protein ES288_A01G237600v1 [Gossypium darwinii]